MQYVVYATSPFWVFWVLIARESIPILLWMEAESLSLSFFLELSLKFTQKFFIYLAPYCQLRKEKYQLKKFLSQGF